jgi:hypothetical protein
MATKATKVKGQHLRIKIDDNVIALATSCSVHISAQMESVSTKDDVGDWESQTPVGKSWDMSTDALFSASAAGSLAKDLVAGTEVSIEFSDVSEGIDGGPTLYTGMAYVSDISINAPNRQNATFTAQFTGNGPLTVSSPASGASEEG